MEIYLGALKYILAPSVNNFSDYWFYCIGIGAFELGCADKRRDVQEHIRGIEHGGGVETAVQWSNALQECEADRHRFGLQRAGEEGDVSLFSCYRFLLWEISSFWLCIGLLISLVLLVQFVNVLVGCWNFVKILAFFNIIESCNFCE